MRDAQIEDFLKYGVLEDKFIYKGLIENNPPFLIYRNKINTILDDIKTHNFICITSDMCNGKSILLKETSYKFLEQGYRVFEILNLDNLQEDLENINKFKIDKTLIIIDGYSNYEEILDYIINTNTVNIKFLLSERSIVHQSLLNYYPKLKTHDINIDELDEKEVDCMANILENTAFVTKKQFLKQQDYREISHVLMDIIKSKQIKDKLLELYEKIVEHRKILFIICLLKLTNKPISPELILDLAPEISSEDIKAFYDEKNNIIYSENNKFPIKSSILSLYVIQEIIVVSDVKNFCLEISERLNELNKNNNLDSIRNSIRKDLLRFRFLENIFDSNKTQTLLNYFKTLKNKITYLKNDPQYWLQYAMAHIAIKNLDKAQRCLKTAYDNAEKVKYDYNKYKIDNQQARLWLKFASNNKITLSDAIKYFDEADKLLAKQKGNTVYKFKVVCDYLDFYETQKNKLQSKEIEIVKKACENKLTELQNLNKIDEYAFKQERIYTICMGNLNKILENICQK